MVHTPLGLTSFPQQNVHEVDPCGSAQHFVNFHFWMIVHCKIVPQCIYPFALGIYIELEGVLPSYTHVWIS